MHQYRWGWITQQENQAPVVFRFKMGILEWGTTEKLMSSVDLLGCRVCRLCQYWLHCPPPVLDFCFPSTYWIGLVIRHDKDQDKEIVQKSTLCKQPHSKKYYWKKTRAQTKYLLFVMRSAREKYQESKQQEEGMGIVIWFWLFIPINFLSCGMDVLSSESLNDHI